jgi:hypothetical protein
MTKGCFNVKRGADVRLTLRTQRRLTIKTKHENAKNASVRLLWTALTVLFRETANDEIELPVPAKGLSTRTSWSMARERSRHVAAYIVVFAMNFMH